MSDTPIPSAPVNQSSDLQVTPSQSKNKRNNRNRNKSKKEKQPKDAKITDATDVVDSQKPKPKSKTKPKPKGKSNNKSNKPQSKALYKELEKLLTIITPITINGIPVSNLSVEPLKFLDNVINDKTNQDEIFMTFLMKPTDPDFPFNIELLSLTLCIPQSYPGKLPSPTVMVLNDDIPRGYSLNIEIGFKQIVATILENRAARKSNKIEPVVEKKVKDNKDTENVDGDEEEVLKIDVVGGNDLAGMVITLDKYLEKFLTMQKRDTIRLVKVINRKQQTVTDLEKASEKDVSAQTARKVVKPEVTLNQEKYKKRTFELEKFRQRLIDNNVSVFRDNSQGTVYKMCLYFKEDHLTLEFDESDQIIIERLYARLTVPKEYLNNSKKGLKLVIDMSNPINIDLVNSIEDTNVRLIFGKLINNITKNFEYFGTDIAHINCADLDPQSNTYWSITSQINFFIHNIQKFMNEKVEFQDWYLANKELNSM